MATDTPTGLQDPGRGEITDSTAMPTEAEFEAAGLLDDLVTTREDRLELLRWLHGKGLDIAEMVDAARSGSLGAIAGDHVLVSSERYTFAEASERSGLPADHLRDLATAFGLTSITGSPPDEVGLTDEELASLALFHALGEIFSEEEQLAFVRVVGSSIARIGEAAVSLFLADVEGPHVLAGRSEVELAEKVLEANGRLDGFADHLDPFIRRHVLQAIERTRVTTIGETERFQYRYAVGFVDLVGFTALSASMPAPELARFLREFEAKALHVAAETGARIVKLIGDEVMFVSTDAASACRTGHALMDAFSGQAGVAPRGGLAYGDVLLRGGDYFGPVVNVASRLVDEAVPGEMLVTVPLAEAATACRFHPAGRRMVKGFAEPIEVRSLKARHEH